MMKKNTKRKNKFYSITAACILCCFLCLVSVRTAYASQTESGNLQPESISEQPPASISDTQPGSDGDKELQAGDGSEISAYSGKIWLEDGAGIFSAEDKQALRDQLDQIREEKGIDTVIVTVDDLQGETIGNLADAYLENGGYGYGSEKNAILLMICHTQYYDTIHISLQGETVQYCFSDERIERMLNDINQDIDSERYARGARAFLEYVSVIMNVDPDVWVRRPVTAERAYEWLVGSVMIGAIVVLVVWLVKRRKTPMAVHAKDYLVKDSINIISQEDTLVDTTTVTRHIEHDD